MIANQSFVFNPQAQYLFRRAYAVNLGPPGQTTALQYGTLVQKTGVEPAALRVAFEIETNTFGASANHSKITLSNLSAQSRQSIKKGYLVQLYAGYNNLTGLIFTGNVFVAKSQRRPQDGTIDTILECLDGGSSITYSRLDKTYPAGTTLITVLTDVARAMNATTDYNPVGVNAGISLNIPAVVFNKGYVAHGPCKDTLDKLLTPQGLEWNVHNGNLNIIPIGNYDGNTAELVSQDTGLIGTPSQNAYFTQFDVLLNPRIYPGRLVQLKCENTEMNGYYKVRKCKYEGDSRGDKWGVSVEATIMPGVVQNANLGEGFNYNSAALA